jgi:hypothetical protein
VPVLFQPGCSSVPATQFVEVKGSTQSNSMLHCQTGYGTLVSRPWTYIKALATCMLVPSIGLRSPHAKRGERKKRRVERVLIKMTLPMWLWEEVAHDGCPLTRIAALSGRYTCGLVKTETLAT